MDAQNAGNGISVLQISKIFWGSTPPDPPPFMRGILATHLAFSHCYPPLIYYLTERSLFKKSPPPTGKILKKALNGTTVSSSTDHRTTLNLYSVVVGPPTTGKSQAIKECAMDPLSDNNDLGEFVLEICTTSALVKCISDQKRGVVVSPEVYDVLNRMLKNEEENGSGEVQMLCELFSGERMSYKYATEKTRNIGENVPFAIIGCTQVPFAARLICRMDQGHGLLDRFLFWFPMCLRPSPHETEAAKGVLNRIPVKSFTDVFLEM